MANTTTKPDLPQVPDGKDDIAFQLAQAKAELEQKNKELQEYHDRLEASMMAGNLAWWQMDVRSGAVLFNEQKTRMLGYSAEEFKHYSDFTRLVHSEDEPLAMQAMRDYLSGKADRYFCEYRIRCADGAYKWFRDIGVASRKSADGRPELLTGVVINIPK
jgi:PAS domain S-box-containing protein